MHLEEGAPGTGRTWVVPQRRFTWTLAFVLVLFYNTLWTGQWMIGDGVRATVSAVVELSVETTLAADLDQRAYGPVLADR